MLHQRETYICQKCNREVSVLDREESEVKLFCCGQEMQKHDHKHTFGGYGENGKYCVCGEFLCGQSNGKNCCCNLPRGHAGDCKNTHRPELGTWKREEEAKVKSF